jgi:hypothetical protein
VDLAAAFRLKFTKYLQSFEAAFLRFALSSTSIELENETLETFSNGISRKKRKLNIFELNSELESCFDPREKRIEDNLKKFQKWARFM